MTAGNRPPLTAGRVTIRPGGAGDAARLRATLADPAVARWLQERGDTLAAGTSRPRWTRAGADRGPDGRR